MTISIELHSRVRTDGLQLVQIKINNQSKRYRVASEIYVKKTQFNKKAKWGKWIKETHPDAHQLNNQLQSKIADIKLHYEKHGIINNTAAIKGDSFFQFAEDFIKKYNNEQSQGTYLTYVSKLAKLKAYAGDKITFNQITVTFIRQYTNHLIELGNSVNTYGVDLKKIKAIFNQAIKEDLVEFSQNPFNKIRIKTEKSKKERLTPEELNAIRNLNLENETYLKHARNIFLFCLNCMGMRIGDAMRLKHSDINGNWIMYSMNKTKDVSAIKINDEIKSILKSYTNKHYLFPYIKKGENEFLTIKRKTALVNKGIKRIAELAEINKKISTHVARHTWTQLAVNSGGNPRTIQKALRHDSFTTTESYIHDLDNSDVNNLNETIFK